MNVYKVVVKDELFSLLSTSESFNGHFEVHYLTYTEATCQNQTLNALSTQM